MADIYTDIINGGAGGTGAWDDPYDTIQLAIDNANGGDTIWIGDSGTNTLGSQLNWTSFGGVQDTSVDERLTVRGWDYSGGAGADGIAVINGNSLAGILAATKMYVTWYHLKISGTDGAPHYAIESNSYNVFNELEITDVTGAGSYALYANSGNYSIVVNCAIRDVVNGIYGAIAVRGCVVSNHSGPGITGTTSCTITGNTTVSDGGGGILVAGDSLIVSDNTVIGDGTTASINGIEIGSTREACVITNNKIIGWGGASNVGVEDPAGNAIAVLGNNHYQGNTLDETASISDDVDIYLSSAGAGPGFVSSGGGASAAAVADAVLKELIADHSGVSGSLAERLTRIPDVAPAASGGLPTVDASNYVAGIAGTVVNTLDEIAGAAYVEGTHALDQTASIGDIADGQHEVLVATTITVTDQTHFVLAAGSADDDAYNDMLVVLEDVSTATQRAVGTVSAYVGATKTVTLSAAPAFTIVTSDKVRILAVGATGTGATASEVWTRAGTDPVAVPGPTATLEAKVNWICAMMLNELSQTSTTQTLRDNADSADIGTATVSDDGTTAIRGKFS